MLAECFMYINSSYPKHKGFYRKSPNLSYIFGRHTQFLVNAWLMQLPFPYPSARINEASSPAPYLPRGLRIDSKVHTYLSFCPIQKSYMHHKPCQPLGKILSCHLFHQMVSIWSLYFLLCTVVQLCYQCTSLMKTASAPALNSQPLCLISSVLKPTNWSQCNGDFDRDVMESPREPGYWRVRVTTQRGNWGMNPVTQARPVL